MLVVQEIFGVHEHIRDIVRRLAKLNYMAIAPELFYRWGNIETIENIEEIRKVVAQVPDSPHAFFADYRPSYRKDTVKDSWERLQKWLKKHGV